MTDWQVWLMACLGVAQGQYLITRSSIMEKIRPRLPKFLRELTSCPICSGFWLSLMFSVMLWPVDVGIVGRSLALGFMGDVLFQLKEKYLPCKSCSTQINLSNWKVK